jgi:ABC-type molybdate transport system substrate-binding protein
MLARLLLAAIMLVVSALPVRAADTLRIYAAGSLTQALTQLLAESGLPPAGVAAPVFGPSGVLRARLEAGETADIFASADLQQPRRLAEARGGRPVVIFARNRICVLARSGLGVTADTVLARMLDPAVRLATSTPGADPGGDYAWAVFARADRLRPGARAVLEAKALKLVGAADSKPLVPGKGQVQGVFLADRADMMLGYCSGSAAVIRDVPGIVSVPLPATLAVGPDYGLVVLTDNPLADRFVVFLMSDRGQMSLARAGFVPVAVAGE